MPSDQNIEMLVFTAPSGAGKTTIVKHLIEHFPSLSFAVSATTRPKRKKEVDGKDYYFKSLEEFEQLVKEDAFVEYEEVYPGKFYGTLKSEIARICQSGKVAIMDMDVKGALTISEKFPETSFIVFVKPPSIQALADRLKKRASESQSTFEARIQRATYEMQYQDSFDACLLNDDLQVAFQEADYLVRDVLNLYDEEE